MAGENSTRLIDGVDEEVFFQIAMSADAIIKLFKDLIEVSGLDGEHLGAAGVSMASQIGFLADTVLSKGGTSYKATRTPSEWMLGRCDVDTVRGAIHD